MLVNAVDMYIRSSFGLSFYPLVIDTCKLYLNNH